MIPRRLWTVLLLATLLPAAPLLQLSAQEPVRVTEEGVFLDFQDTDLRLVITALAEIGGFSVSYSNVPDRRVTLRTAHPVTPEDAERLLRSVARANGLLVVEENDLYRIRPAAPGELEALERGPDQPEADLRIFVYRLKHAGAPRLAATLQALFGGTASTSVPRGRAPATLSERLRQELVAPGIPVDEPGEVAEVEPGVPPGIPGQLSGEIQVVPDERTNSLLVRANARDWEVIRQTIEELDLRPLQVLIEALIAEVRRDQSFELGTSFNVRHAQSEDSEVSGTLVGRTIGDLILQVIHLDSTSIDVVLQAVAADSDVSILSRPVIFAQNNQPARILIGSERPFVQVFRSLPTEAAVRDQVVQFRDVGTSLTITPTINGDGYVDLEMVQEVSSATAETQFGAPVISTREASTQVFLRDGQTAVIGGLIEQQVTETRTGVPLLKDIPLLGYLFSSTRDVTARNELFILLTVHVLDEDDDIDRIRREVESEADFLRTPLKPIIPPPGVVPDTTMIPHG